MRKVLSFGVFDGLHDGHRAFLREARSCGDCLIVAVARDEASEAIKGRFPSLPLSLRIRDIKESGIADEVVAGDSAAGSYSIIKKVKPIVIALGYDQEKLKTDLEKRRNEIGVNFEIKVMKPYEPEKLHSSITNN